MKQLLKILTHERDGDEFGNEWRCHYVLYETADDADEICYDLYAGDGEGNGTLVARGYDLPSIRHMALRLGEFVEWETGVPVRRVA